MESACCKRIDGDARDDRALHPVRLGVRDRPQRSQTYGALPLRLLVHLVRRVLVDTGDRARYARSELGQRSCAATRVMEARDDLAERVDARIEVLRSKEIAARVERRQLEAQLRNREREDDPLSAIGRKRYRLWAATFIVAMSEGSDLREAADASTRTVFRSLRAPQAIRAKSDQLLSVPAIVQAVADAMVRYGLTRGDCYAKWVQHIKGFYDADGEYHSPSWPALAYYMDRIVVPTIAAEAERDRAR